jgi:hypothetical protein
MLTTEGSELKARNAHDILNKYIHSPNKITDINDILKDFKVNLQEVKEYEEKTNKRLVKFGINHDKRYKPFYQSVLNLKEEHYFVYGLLAQIFRQNFRKNEEGELRLVYITSVAFQECLERNYQEEMKFIKIYLCDSPEIYKFLYSTYILLEGNFIERYYFLYHFCLHRD